MRRLLSNRAAENPEQAVELIDWYRARWEIELFFLILKEARIEAPQLGEVERLKTPGVTWWVSWRINRLNHNGNPPAVPG